MINSSLLKAARAALMEKRAYVPMTPEAMAAAQQAPPMDPAMLQGTPPPLSPMDPAMMQGTPPLSPMDPAMMQGTPPPLSPMDPAMMQGTPPPVPADMPLQVNLSDLEQIFKQVSGSAGTSEEAAGEAPSGRVTNRQIKAQLDEIQQLLSIMADAFGIYPPVQETGSVPEASNAPAAPSDIMAAVSQAPGTPPSAPSEGMPVAAGRKDKLTRMIERLKHFN